MCGIIGYTGVENAVPILVNGLKSLEYRGYDSSGIAVFEKDVVVVKEKGKISNLESKLQNIQLSANVGIGHTRWATHGRPDEINAHPHSSVNRTVTLVHNGIIENYAELKNELINMGYEFTSQTDTEVIAQLFESLFDGNAISTMIKTAEKLQGSYAVAMLIKGNEDKIYAMKKDSPLIVGKGENENFLASDIPAILSHTKDCYIVNDGEFVEISKNNIKIFDSKGVEKHFTTKRVDLTLSANEKNGYTYYMLKEIFEQPKAVRNTVAPLISNGKITLPFTPSEKLNHIHIVGCGSAYHVGVTGKYIIEELTRIPVTVDIASEFRYRNPIINKNDLCIFISQSGETADTLASLREAKRKGAFTLSIVNVPYSTISRESDAVIHTYAGHEIAVATTKAFSSQLAVLYILALFIRSKQNCIENYIDELLALPEKIEKTLKCENQMKLLAKHIATRKNVFFIGRGVDYPLCLEGSLKLKEISYIHSEGYGAGELKHGTISLIEEGTVVIALATDDTLLGKMISNMKEVASRGAILIAITNEDNNELEKIANHVIYVPKTNKIFSPSLTAIPLQLLAYHTTIEKGLDPDKPRNLDKSVTVE